MAPPYRHAWIAILVLIGFTVWAFWPSYFSVFGDARLAHHIHGLTGMLWLLLLTAQSWSIHNGRASLHRNVGKASFVVFPLFMVGGALVFQTSARAFATQSNPFSATFAARIGIMDVVAAAAMAWLFFMALRERRNVQLHARYMLATSLFLFNPVFGRLFSTYVPGLAMHGPQDFHLFAYSIHLADALPAAIALGFFASARRYGRPWLVAAGALALQNVLYEVIGGAAWWEKTFTSVLLIPAPVLVATALATGAGTVWFGWRRPGAPAGPSALRPTENPLNAS